MISWTTNEQAINQILYGLTTDYSKSTSLDNLALSHSITLSELEQGKDYHFKILSKDALGNENYFTGQFTTLGCTNIQVSSIDNTSAVITWATNRNTDSYVEYGTSTTYGYLEGNNTPTTIHSVRLVNLFPGTNYNFRIKATESSGISYSQNYSFKTLGEQSSESSLQPSKFNSIDSKKTTNPTITISQITRSTKQQVAIPRRERKETDKSDNLITKPSDFKEKTISSPTGVVAGVSSNKDNNWKIVAVLALLKP